MAPEFFVKTLRELPLRLLRSLGFCDAETVGHAEDVGVHGDGVAAVGDGVDDVRRLAPHSAEFHQSLSVRRHPAHLHDGRGRFFDGFRFVVVEPAGENEFFQLLRRHGDELFRRRRVTEKLRGDHVDAPVRALRGKDDRDEQLERRAEVQLAVGIPVHFVKQLVDFCVFRIHADIIAHFSFVCNAWRGEFASRPGARRLRAASPPRFPRCRKILSRNRSASSPAPPSPARGF